MSSIHALQAALDDGRVIDKKRPKNARHARTWTLQHQRKSNQQCIDYRLFLADYTTKDTNRFLTLFVEGLLRITMLY